MLQINKMRSLTNEIWQNILSIVVRVNWKNRFWWPFVIKIIFEKIMDLLFYSFLIASDIYIRLWITSEIV